MTCVPGKGGTLAVTLLRDDLFKACCGSDHATAVLLAAFPSAHTPVVAATACLVPFLLDPAAALGRPPPWRMKLQCVSLVAAFLLGVSSAACMRLPPSESVLAGFRLPSWSSVRSWLLCLWSGPLSAPALLPAPTPVPAHVRPCAQGRCDRCPLGFGVMSDFFIFFAVNECNGLAPMCHIICIAARTSTPRWLYCSCERAPTVWHSLLVRLVCLSSVLFVQRSLNTCSKAVRVGEQ